jgi:iron complex outermembrane receptor protein
MKKLGMVLILMGLVMVSFPRFGLAEEAGEKQAEKRIAEKTDKNEATRNESKILKVEDIQVTAPREDEGVVLEPSATTIYVEDYEQSGIPQTIVDILRDRAIVDFQGYSDLTQDDDNIYVRGFDSRNFVSAMDGLSLGKVGGYMGGHFTDFSSIPFNQIESVEIIPGPHSALYSGRSIGGVLNVRTKTPKRYETTKPDLKVMTSYRSYNTQTHRVNVDGGVNSIIYGCSYEKYHTDGYLKHNESDTDTVFARIGYILPSSGYISFSTTHQDAERESPVYNNPEGRYSAYYDSSYPKTESGSNPSNPTRRDKTMDTYQLTFKQPTSFGEWSAGAYYTHEDQKYNYEQVSNTYYDTEWNTYGAMLQNEIRLFDDHLVTMGFDYEQLRNKWDKVDMDISYGAYIQDKWTVLPRLSLTAGLRYEYITIWWNNLYSWTAGQYCDPSHPEDYVKREYNQVLPKSFLTYELDDLSEYLRDTSVSLGVSRIWTPKSYCQTCSAGSGVELDPVHGVGYDLVLTRRLWKDINLKADFYYYELNDYVVSTSDREYIAEGLWSRRNLNLEQVVKEGVELELNGRIFDPLSFYVSYAYTDWRYHGPDTWPYGDAAEKLDDRAKNRINAGLRYNLFQNTRLLLDYKYQDDQIQIVCEEEPEGSNNWNCYDNPMDAYHVFDFAVEQTLFKDYGIIKDMVLKFYVDNLFDEEYENSRGYPMTDRTYGATLSFKM